MARDVRDIFLLSVASPSCRLTLGETIQSLSGGVTKGSRCNKARPQLDTVTYVDISPLSRENGDKSENWKMKRREKTGRKKKDESSYVLLALFFISFFFLKSLLIYFPVFLSFLCWFLSGGRGQVEKGHRHFLVVKKNRQGRKRRGETKDGRGTTKKKKESRERKKKKKITRSGCCVKSWHVLSTVLPWEGNKLKGPM